MLYEKYYGLTVYEMLKKAYETFGNKNLFSYMRDGRVEHVSYEKFWGDIHTVAKRFESYEISGKYVVIEGKQDYELIVAIYAVISAGAIATILNLDLPEQDINRAMDLTHPALIICNEEGYEAVEAYARSNGIECVLGSEDTEGSIREWINIGGEWFEYQGNQHPEDPALVLMTSGSTTQSKLVLSSHYAFIPRKEFITEKSILVFPLYHIGGLAVLHIGIAYGMEMCLSNMKDGMRDIEWFRPTDMAAVPAFISMLVGKSKQNLLDMSCFQSLTSSAAPQNLEDAKYLNKLGIFTYSTYGATETAGPVGYATPGENRFGSVGKPGPWNEVKISEEGEILLKGKNVMIQYLGNPEETEKTLVDGWYHTGDAGRIDEEGFLFITGRIKNIIILSNGENVSPEAIESKLNQCEEIVEVVVRGEDDEIVAHVWCGEVADEAKQSTVKKFIANYNRTVPSYYSIRKTVFREAPFEKTATGKIKR